jgi:hypothetical protein
VNPTGQPSVAAIVFIRRINLAGKNITVVVSKQTVNYDLYFLITIITAFFIDFFLKKRKDDGRSASADRSGRSTGRAESRCKGPAARNAELLLPLFFLRVTR